MSRKGRDNLLKRCTCRERSWPTCTHPWYFRMEYGGQSYGFPLWKTLGHPRITRYTKQEAEAHRDRIRAAIYDGTFTSAVTKPVPPAGPPLRLAEVAAAWVQSRRADASRRPHRHAILERDLAAIMRTTIEVGKAPIKFGDLPIADVRRFHIDAFREARRQHYRQVEADVAARSTPSQSTPERPGAAKGETGINRAMQTLRALMNWSLERDFRSDTPFHHNGRPVIRLTKERARSRVMSADEERRLLLAAKPHLRALITAALETGCRKGELLSLTWADVEHEGDTPTWLALRGERTKTGQARVVPVSLTLAALLTARRLDPNGDPLPPSAYVFGNEVGEKVDSVKTAWRGTCRRAGISDLTFHDLRRTAGSRFLQYGVPLHDVRDQLGHASVAQTDTYLNGTRETRRAAVLRAERKRLGLRAAEATG